jgi:hypothetical protein
MELPHDRALQEYLRLGIFKDGQVSTVRRLFETRGTGMP